MLQDSKGFSFFWPGTMPCFLFLWSVPSSSRLPCCGTVCTTGKSPMQGRQDHATSIGFAFPICRNLAGLSALRRANPERREKVAGSGCGGRRYYALQKWDTRSEVVKQCLLVV